MNSGKKKKKRQERTRKDGTEARGQDICVGRDVTLKDQKSNSTKKKKEGGRENIFRGSRSETKDFKKKSSVKLMKRGWAGHAPGKKITTLYPSPGRGGSWKN